jgi:hypothetical protein
MTTHQDLLSGLDKIADEGLNELLRRVQDINNSYRAVAEKMGQLYMCADELQLTALTRDLDKPMRNASDNEQLFAAILEDLQSFARRPS